MPTITCCINADTRPGYLTSTNDVNYGINSLTGVRSVDFLTEGVKQKMNYFRGYDCQCILYIDEHEKMSDSLFMEVVDLVHSYGNNSKVVCRPHNRTKHKWNDYLYLEGLKLAEGDYVVHFDQDCNAYRTDDCDIIEKYFKWLDEGYKYICQPWNGIGDKMFWASTRFFICKRGTLNLPLIESSIPINPLMGKRNPCLEFTLGILAGEGKVLYPPREDDKYIVFSWARYFPGTLKKLNDMQPNEALKYISELGLHGANDCIDKQ